MREAIEKNPKLLFNVLSNNIYERFTKKITLTSVLMTQNRLSESTEFKQSGAQKLAAYLRPQGSDSFLANHDIYIALDIHGNFQKINWDFSDPHFDGNGKWMLTKSQRCEIERALNLKDAKVCHLEGDKFTHVFNEEIRLFEPVSLNNWSRWGLELPQYAMSYDDIVTYHQQNNPKDEPLI